MLPETSYWMDHGERELKEALQQPRITNKAKNVILFLGDGKAVNVKQNKVNVMERKSKSC